MTMKRKPFIGGNWKSNGSRLSVSTLVQGLNVASVPSGIDVCVAPTNLYLDSVSQSLKRSYLVAAQDSSAFTNGAYTGKVSAEQLRDFGVGWVIIGHSETRHEGTVQYFGKKVAMAMKAGLSVIACVGETLEQRKSNKVMPTLIAQLKPIIDSVSDWSRIVIAYEPIWAIGTGVTASPNQAQEVHHNIRTLLKHEVGPSVADTTRIIYGGSVKPKNCDSLFSMEDIDGFLVGGASLKAKSFETIFQAPQKLSHSKL